MGGLCRDLLSPVSLSVDVSLTPQLHHGRRDGSRKDGESRSCRSAPVLAQVIDSLGTIPDGSQLQCITLLWTHLRQSLLPNKQLIDKVIVVCPASLVRNWANELVKWLGEGATNPLALDDKTNMADSVRQVRQWCSTKGKQVVTPSKLSSLCYLILSEPGESPLTKSAGLVLIASYERLRNLVAEIGETEVGLLLADEGHRLKNYSTSPVFTSAWASGQQVQDLRFPRPDLQRTTPT